MSTYAQRAQLGPFFSSGIIQGSAKLYHYEPGTSTLKNIWEDRSKATTLAQPFVADANGVFNFFADGIYKVIICGPNSTGPSVDVLYTLDNWSFLDPTDPTFDEGTSISSASTLAVGPEIWAHVTGSTNIDALDGTIPFFWAVFDGNLTINYSASLLTPASINVAVRQGDVCMFLRENEAGTIWRLAAHYQADGLVISTQDSRTNTVDVALTVRSTTSGTAAAGIGTGILLQAESADESPCDALQLEGQLSDVAAGSEDSTFRVLLRTAGAALSIAWEWARASGAFVGIFTHANTANRVYTLPDATDTLVGRATVDTLTNKTISAGILSGCSVTGAAPATPTANVLYTDSLVKGFVAFQVTGTIDTDLNVSSITDNGVGDWTVNWATAFSSANYCLNVSAQADGIIGASDGTCTFNVDSSNNPTASAARVIYSSNNGGNRTPSDPTGARVRLYVSALGLQ